MKNYSNITCAALTPQDVSAKVKEELILSLLERHELTYPTHIGNYEPINIPYTGVNRMQNIWCDPFLWKNTLSKVEGSIWFGRGIKHSCLYVHQKLEHIIDQEKWKNFLNDISISMQVDIAYVHLTSTNEFADKSIPHDYTYSLDLGVTTQNLRKGIPNLAWGMIFGEVYGELISEFRKSNELSEIIDISDKMTYIQLTPSISDILVDYVNFNVKRRKVINEVGACFFSSLEGVQKVPRFSFEKNEATIGL